MFLYFRILIEKGTSFLSQLLKGKRSLACLNISQFLGVLNDNVYKFLMIFLLLSLLGTEKSGIILPMAGALYVIPFLLFSSAAGVLADRFSKQKLILLLKGSEILLTLLALWAFSSRSIWGSYSLLFLLATHSALLGPSKYGILPELVDKSEVPSANGHITASTYLAIISGTFLASFLTQKTGENYTVSVSFCIIFSLIGFLFALKIKKTIPQRSTKRIRFFFLREIYETVRDCRTTPMLVSCLWGSAYFLFVGAFTQLNIIPFAIEALHLSEYAGGYLFLLTAFGIMGGSLLAGRWLQRKSNVGISCMAGALMSVLFFCIRLFSFSWQATAVLLFLLGICGGVFVICFDTFIQLNSPIEKRGQRIAAANFLGFVGVLLASFFLYLFGEIFDLSSADGFLCMAGLTFLMTLFLAVRLSEVFVPFFSSHMYCPLKTNDPDELARKCSVFLLEEFRWSLFLSAVKLSSRCKILVVGPVASFSGGVLKLFPAVSFLSADISLEKALREAEKIPKEEATVFLFLGKPFFEVKEPERGFFSSFRLFSNKEICVVRERKKELWIEKSNL